YRPVGGVMMSSIHSRHASTRVNNVSKLSIFAAHVDRFFATNGRPAIYRIHLLGTSGTVTTIAGVHLELKRYDRRRVDGCWMSDDQVTQVIERLLTWDYDGRVANACIGAERADLVLAGCAILEAI